MDEWQARTRDYYARMWVDRESSDKWLKPSPALEWYDLCTRMNNEYWSGLFSQLAPGKRLLECGGATGQFTAHMAARGWDCTQIDITSEGPLLARKRFAKEGVSGAFVTANVCHLPFRDASFDVVTSNGLLDLMPDVAVPIREMSRVLKPDGVFAAAFFPKRFSVQSLADSFLGVVRFLDRTVSGGHIVGPSTNLPSYGNVFRNDYPLKIYLEACHDAGLTALVGKGIWPLPMLSLPVPDPVMRGYVRLARRLEPLWAAFNRSTAPWTAKWGAMLAVYGIKAR